MSSPFPYEAYNQINTLIGTLRMITERDPEQDVLGIAIPVLDKVISLARESLCDHPIVGAIRDVISPEQLESGEPVRAVDALLVASQLSTAMGNPPLTAEPDDQDAIFFRSDDLNF